MGTLRTLLAISVLLSHTYGFVLVGGPLAVQCFYLISGYLISYILAERHSYARIRDFYASRALRILPLYAAASAFALLVALLLETFGPGTDTFRIFRALDTAGQIALALSHLTVIGQDWLWFTGMQNGVFGLMADFNRSEVPVAFGLLIPPSWTLGIELSFYLLAPFLLTDRRWLLAALAASLALRGWLIWIGLGFDGGWYYRFFPTELALFLFGALAHQLLAPLYARVFAALGWISVAVTLGVLGLVLAFATLPPRLVAEGTLALLIITTLALPGLFHFQVARRWDRRLGALSYPIYLLHWPVLKALDLGPAGLGDRSADPYGACAWPDGPSGPHRRTGDHPPRRGPPRPLQIFRRLHTPSGMAQMMVMISRQTGFT